MKTRTQKKAAPKKLEPEVLIHLSRESCDVMVWKHGPKKFGWRVQQSFDNFTNDEPQEGDLDQKGVAMTLQDATKAAFYALADHIGIE